VRKYDWKLILLLSLPGPVMGLLTLYGVIPFGTDRWIWLPITIVAAVTIARRVESNAFGHGALVGFLLYATSKLVHGVWSDTYLAHNPILLDEHPDATEALEFKYRMLMFVPLLGIANAVLVGVMSYFTFKAMPSNRPATKT